MIVQILGMGSIGTFLAYALSKKGLNVLTYDERRREGHFLYEATINGSPVSMHLINNVPVARCCDFVIVTLKSYDLKDRIFDNLSESNKQVLFLQNGVSTYLAKNGQFNNFHFGTIYGIQAKSEMGIADIRTQNVTVAIIPNQNDSIFKQLETVSLKDCLLLHPIDNSKRIYLEKFIRWIISSIICSKYRMPLGSSLRCIQDRDLDLLIASINSFVCTEFNLEVDSGRIREALFRLPSDLITSATRDHLTGQESELYLEIEFVISKMDQYQLDTTNLRYWSSHLKNV